MRAQDPVVVVRQRPLMVNVQRHGVRGGLPDQAEQRELQAWRPATRREQGRPRGREGRRARRRRRWPWPTWPPWPYGHLGRLCCLGLGFGRPTSPTWTIRRAKRGGTASSRTAPARRQRTRTRCHASIAFDGPALLDVQDYTCKKWTPQPQSALRALRFSLLAHVISIHVSGGRDKEKRKEASDDVTEHFPMD